MTYDAVLKDRAALRPDFDITLAVHQHGLAAVLWAAMIAALHRPRIPPDLPPRLRADMGLPPARGSLFWPEMSETPGVPLIVWRPGL
jgi:hypothetical protein